MAETKKKPEEVEAKTSTSKNNKDGFEKGKPLTAEQYAAYQAKLRLKKQLYSVILRYGIIKTIKGGNMAEESKQEDKQEDSKHKFAKPNSKQFIFTHLQKKRKKRQEEEQV